MSPVLVSDDGGVQVTAPLGPAARSAARGAALLDEARPGWASEIDITDLAVGSVDLCVIGQLYCCQTHEDYFRALAELAPPTVSDYAIDDWAAEHGFAAHPDVTDPVMIALTYARLLDAWLAEIGRRTEDLPPEPDAPADPGATRPPAPPRSQGPRGGGRG